MSSLLNDWFAEYARDLPWRRADRTPWGVMVSEFMLQQTPVNRVLLPWAQWLERWPTPSDLANTPLGDAVAAWGNLGYPRRALRLHHCASSIRDNHGGAVPRALDELLGLPGVGTYTARAIAVFAFGDRHPVVDTNTRRVLARHRDGRAHPGPPSARDLVVMNELLPDDRSASTTMNAAAMELGATVCVSHQPRCDRCPLADSCAWRLAGHPATPDTRKKQARYEGSDRQARGALLKVLRAHPGGVVPQQDLARAWPDIAQRHRAQVTLVADGLAEATDEGLRLPR